MNLGMVLYKSSFCQVIVSSIRLDSFQINALSSVSMTTIIVSGMAVLEYQFAVRRIVDLNLFFTNIEDWMSDEAHFANKGAPLELTDQENTSIAISSLVVIFSAIEIALAVCVALSSDSPYQRSQGRQIIQVCAVLSLMEAREKKIVLCIPPSN